MRIYAIFFKKENEALRDRIERILNKVKTFTNRKREELNQSIDSGFGSIDLGRRSIEMKVKDNLFNIPDFNQIFFFLEFY
jgi:hypothetical protein